MNGEDEGDRQPHGEVNGEDEDESHRHGEEKNEDEDEHHSCTAAHRSTMCGRVATKEKS